MICYLNTLKHVTRYHGPTGWSKRDLLSWRYGNYGSLWPRSWEWLCFEKWEAAIIYSPLTDCGSVGSLWNSLTHTSITCSTFNVTQFEYVCRSASRFLFFKGLYKLYWIRARFKGIVINWGPHNQISSHSEALDFRALHLREIIQLIDIVCRNSIEYTYKMTSAFLSWLMFCVRMTTPVLWVWC